jgi:hypothetical protein
MVYTLYHLQVAAAGAVGALERSRLELIEKACG